MTQTVRTACRWADTCRPCITWSLFGTGAENDPEHFLTPLGASWLISVDALVRPVLPAIAPVA